MTTLLLSIVSFFYTSIYSLQFQNSSGATINVSSFQGKKILLVNIASGSSRVGQLDGLRQLQQQHGDSLVIIAFPSNSFGNEPRTDAEIAQFCQSTYNSNFIIAAKGSVQGAGIQSIYHWLANQTENGDTNLAINADFQKVLIAKDGSIQAVFSPKVLPMDADITEAIAINY